MSPVLLARQSGSALGALSSAVAARWPKALITTVDIDPSLIPPKVSLGDAVSRAVDLHGNGVEIHLAAHSMGGLVSRYFLQSSKFNGTKGTANIDSFLTFGTPHKGAVVALAAALGQHKASFMSLDQSAKLANDPRFQGLYNLFPQPGSRPIWERVAKAHLKASDVFDNAVGQKLKLNPQSLADTLKVFDALAMPWPSIRTFLFVGTGFETMTHILWDGVKPVIVRTPDGGDGTVNLQGAMFADQQILFTDKNHTGLIGADGTRDALQELFNASGLLLATDASVSLAPAEHFFESGQAIEVALSITGPGARVHGKLYLERARINPSVEDLVPDDFTGAAPEDVREFLYEGPDLTLLNVKFEGVQGPAALRPIFETFDAVPRRFEGPTFLVMAPG